MALNNADRELAFTPAYQLKELILKKQLSPVELLDAILRRVEEINPKLNAYLTLTREEAYQAARRAEKVITDGDTAGPLHGIPISIKDLVEMKGIRTTFGSLPTRDNIPQTEDGTMIRRLKRAGAVIIGKTNTPEFGLASHTENRIANTLNPWNTDRTPGGSSGGASAAVASGISPLAQGSDGGGSIRIPSALSGIFGIKPTNGRVPMDVHGWGMSHVSCWGPMTRNVRDAALMLNVIAGPDGMDYTCIRTQPPDYLAALKKKQDTLRIAYSADLGYVVRVDPAVASAFEQAVKVFESLGHNLEAATPRVKEPFDLWDINASTRYSIPYGSLIETHPDELSDYTRTYLGIARDATGVEVARSWIEVEKTRAEMLSFFEKYDLLLAPVTAVPAPKIGQRDKSLGKGGIDWVFCPFTAIFNFSQNPGASVPCGFTPDGLPVGLQIIGRIQDEATVLRAAAAFEEACPWADKYPPIS
ncbi:amidase [Chloroflexota bacterium]